MDSEASSQAPLRLSRLSMDLIQKNREVKSKAKATGWLGAAGSERYSSLDLHPEARFAEQLLGPERRLGVEGEDEGGPLGVGVAHV